MDAERPRSGPAEQASAGRTDSFAAEVAATRPRPTRKGAWKPGDAPSQAARWYVDAIAKAGTIGLIGFYPPTHETFPIGQAMNKNLVIGMGDAEHRRYIPELLDLIASGVVDPSTVLIQRAVSDRRARDLPALRPA